MKNEQKVVGIDVSKARLDLAVVPGGTARGDSNDDSGINGLLAYLKQLQPDLVVMEASGGYETAAAIAISAAGIRLAVVNPRQVRDFAKASGYLAKTDAIDARLIAQFGLMIEPEVSTLPCALRRRGKQKRICCAHLRASAR